MILVIKICLLGDGAVGKSSLKRRFMGEQFEKSYYLTIGADFAVKNVTLTSGRTIRFQIWDLAGQPHFDTVRSLYYKGCMGAIAVYDVTRPATLENLEKWIQEFWSKNGAGPRPIVTLGNKADLQDQIPSNSLVPGSEGDKFSQTLQTQCIEFGAETHYYDTSAKTGANVDEAFKTLGDLIEVYLKKNTQYGPPGGLG